jgi:glycosyltransferase involved in cell wall biosynthesis
MRDARCLAIVPAFNEEASVGAVVREIRAFDPRFEVLVVDDASDDRTAAVAAAAGARVVRLPFNLGIGGAVQTGYRHARDAGFDVAVQIDGDGQHDPRELPAVLAPVLRGDADVAIGSRFVGEPRYAATGPRRLAMRVFARVVSLVVGQPLTDTTSSFRAVGRRGIRLFASDYPHGFLETVEATVSGARSGLRLVEVPVAVRQRAVGRSSLTTARSLFYTLKVLLAIFVGLFRPRVALEEL